MSDIEVVREARAWLDEHEVNHGPEFHSPKVVKEAERFAQAVISLEAELAQAKQALADAPDQSALDAAQFGENAARAALAQAREERDRMIEVTAEHPERAYTWYAEMRRYREALERIAAMNSEWDEDGRLDVDEAPAIARAALTDEPEPGGWDKRIPPEAYALHPAWPDPERPS